MFEVLARRPLGAGKPFARETSHYKDCGGFKTDCVCYESNGPSLIHVADVLEKRLDDVVMFGKFVGKGAFLGC